jgi:hypothetical protein
MADAIRNIAASVKQRLLNLAREQGKSFDILLVRFALEPTPITVALPRAIHPERRMLVTQWLDHDNRETRDIDFLGFGSDDPGEVKTVSAEIMAIEVLDGLVFDTVMLSASPIREDMEYGGIRLRTAAYLERTRIPVVLDIGFGDALANASQSIEYTSLLDMERPHIRSYPPASVIAEKFQAVVALGLANGRMKDFYDLWAVPKTVEINAGDLDAAIAATFERRTTPVPQERPPGLSDVMALDPIAAQRWRAYIGSLELPALDFMEVLDDIWGVLGSSCERLLARQ